MRWRVGKRKSDGLGPVVRCGIQCCETRQPRALRSASRGDAVAAVRRWAILIVNRRRRRVLLTARILVRVQIGEPFFLPRNRGTHQLTHLPGARVPGVIVCAVGCRAAWPNRHYACEAALTIPNSAPVAGKFFPATICPVESRLRETIPCGQLRWKRTIRPRAGSGR